MSGPRRQARISARHPPHDPHASAPCGGHRRGDHRPVARPRAARDHPSLRRDGPAAQGTRAAETRSARPRHPAVQGRLLSVDLPLGRRRASPSAACHKMRIWSGCANWRSCSGGGCANWRRFPQEGCGRVDEGIAAFDAAGGGHQERSGLGAGRGTRACHRRRRLPGPGRTRRGQTPGGGGCRGRRGADPGRGRQADQAGGGAGTGHRRSDEHPTGTQSARCADRRTRVSCRRPRWSSWAATRCVWRQPAGSSTSGRGASRGRDDVTPGGGGRVGRDQEGGRHERLGRAGGPRRSPPSSGRASSTRHAPAAGGRGRRSRPGTMPGRVTVRGQRRLAARPVRPQDAPRRMSATVTGPPPRSCAGNGTR